jgi:hypothetical protein
MELSFATEELRGICESRRRATNKLGADTAKSLEMVLADIDACQNVLEFTALYGDHAAPTTNDWWQITLEGGGKMTFVSGHVSTPRKKEGRTDWQKVTRVKIEAIGAKP